VEATGEEDGDQCGGYVAVAPVTRTVGEEVADMVCSCEDYWLGGVIEAERFVCTVAL
jgi:hypothetical protein